VSTQEGLKGVLLGSAATMALPPPAAAELLHAHSSVDIPDSTATQADIQAALQALVKDYALCWRLYSSRQHAEPYPEHALLPETAASGAGTGGQPEMPALLESLLSDLLHYLKDNNMQACHDLLVAHATTSPTSPASHPAAAAATAAAAAAAAEATTSSAAAAADPSCQGQLAPGSPQQGPVALLQRLAGLMSRVRAMSRNPQYTAWRLQRRRWVDLNGWAVPTTMYVAGTALVWKRLLADAGFLVPSALSVVMFLLHTLTGLGVHVLLAAGGERTRARREVLVVLFAAAKALVCLASVWRWLPLPANVRLVWSSLRAVVVIHGVCRPCLIQVMRAGTAASPSMPGACVLLICFGGNAADHCCMQHTSTCSRHLTLPRHHFCLAGTAQIRSRKRVASKH
jgi:hypothetical protein